MTKNKLIALGRVTSRKTKGFSLVEVLIAIFVLAFGALIAASMQSAALVMTQQSGYQTIAMNLANELADDLRVHSPSMKLDYVRNPFLQMSYASDLEGEPTPPAKFCYGTNINCDADEMAQFEIYEMKKRVKLTLPNGRIQVCRDSAPWDNMVGRYKWSCTSSDSDAAPIVIKIGWSGKAMKNNGVVGAGGQTQSSPKLVLAVSSSGG